MQVRVLSGSPTLKDSQMRKLIAALLVSTALVATSAEAFYSKNFGQWTVQGQPVVGDMSPVCKIETGWPNGAKLVLINDLADQELYIGYFNPQWNITDAPGTNLVTILELVDDKTTFKVSFVYEVVSPTTIRIRHIKYEFFLLFASASKMTLHMPGNIPSITVGLKGTKATMGGMEECRGLAKDLGILQSQPLPAPAAPVIPKKPGIQS